ncbi:MAG: TIGR01906 family membrane protein [Eubacteriales bacterium]|nr:TIGR01906 family membrane protein [Eubacteriales bacterium]
MRRIVASFCTAIGSALLIIALLIMSIEMFAFNQGFFKSEYEKLDTADRIGMSEEDLTAVTEKLLGYTAGEEDSLDMQAEINGGMKEVFGQREKDHMVDVRALYLGARDVRTISLAGAAVLFVLAFILRGKKALLSLCRSFLYVSGVFLIVVAAVGLYAAVDFSAFWTSFHHVFFTNDLWLLSPTDVLIMMVPEQFFSDLVARIIIRFVSLFITLNIAAVLGVYLYKKRQRRADVKEVPAS